MELVTLFCYYEFASVSILSSRSSSYTAFEFLVFIKVRKLKILHNSEVGYEYSAAMKANIDEKDIKDNKGKY